MREYEFSFFSVNSERYPKNITAVVIEPDRIDPDTGVMLFSHGWSGNRFQNLEKMKFTADRFNLICLSVEYRQSGFDFDHVRGLGSYVPYDYSFMQVFDVLNGLRTLLYLRNGLSRKRIFHYGGSQGGHIALLSGIYAPNTFSFIYAASPLVYAEDKFEKRAGRNFTPWERNCRDGVYNAREFRCFLCLEHGTEDEVVDHRLHTVKLTERLSELRKEHAVEYFTGGGHDLRPVTTRDETYIKKVPEYLQKMEGSDSDDFTSGSKIELDCGEKTLYIDWSEPCGSINLFSWK